MNDLKNIIGNNIRDLRKENKLTQTELAEKLNYTNKSISRWESGEVMPDIETLEDICDVFNIPIDNIFIENLTQNKQPTKVKKSSKLKVGNKLAVTLLAVMAVWLVAICMFVIGEIVFKYNFWLVYIYAVPVSCIVGLVFNCIWGKKWGTFTLISLLVWTLITCLYITLMSLSSTMWLLFLIGIPLQFAILLWACIKPKKNTNIQNN